MVTQAMLGRGITKLDPKGPRGVSRYRVTICFTKGGSKHRKSVGCYYHLECAREAYRQARAIVDKRGFITDDQLDRIKKDVAAAPENNPARHKKSGYSTVTTTDGSKIALLRVNCSQVYLGQFTKAKYANSAIFQARQRFRTHGELTHKDVLEIRKAIVDSYPEAMSARSRIRLNTELSEVA